MSFRELRSFAETMRLLGYPNLISMESFRNPNVELVADCLYLLIKRYDPSAEVVYDIERESDRVFFFKQICEVALAKGRIKLNVKKLYQSDGHAVQEMLKLANVLKKAMKATDEEELDFAGLQQMAAQKNINDAKAVQQLCSELTADGSSLFFMVDEETQNRTERQRVLSRATEVGEFERRLRELLTSVSQQVEQLQQSITNLSADETNLEQKIENKKTQLERAQKRYKSLMAVRPAFVEEYDKHEAELQSQFVKYLEQYRNLEFLEYQLAKFNSKEDAMLEEQETKLRVMRERLRKEELKTLRAEGGGSMRPAGARRVAADDDDDDEDDITEGVRMRDAMIEGSSVDSSEETDEDSRGAPPRPQNALGRSRPSPSAELENRRHGGGGPGTMMDSDGDDDRENVVGSMRKPRMGGNGVGIGGSGRPPITRPSQMHGDDDDDSTSEDNDDDSSDDSDDSSDLTTSSDGDDDSDDSDSGSDESDI